MAFNLARSAGLLAFQTVPVFSCIVVDVAGVAILHPAVSVIPASSSAESSLL
jgi:hypothetical protein